MYSRYWLQSDPWSLIPCERGIVGHCLWWRREVGEQTEWCMRRDSFCEMRDKIISSSLIIRISVSFKLFIQINGDLSHRNSSLRRRWSVVVGKLQILLFQERRHCSHLHFYLDLSDWLMLTYSCENSNPSREIVIQIAVKITFINTNHRRQKS